MWGREQDGVLKEKQAVGGRGTDGVRSTRNCLHCPLILQSAGKGNMDRLTSMSRTVLTTDMVLNLGGGGGGDVM